MKIRSSADFVLIENFKGIEFDAFKIKNVFLLNTLIFIPKS